MRRIKVYNSTTPLEAGAVGPDFKPERVTAPAIGGMCFQNMRSLDDLKAACSTAPATHQQAMDWVISHGKKRGDFEPPRRVEKPQPRAQVTISAARSFTRGRYCKDKVSQRKGIIIHANAGYTRKTNQPVHKLADKNGNSWLAKQKDLILLD